MNHRIMENLEALAAAMPWDSVAIWTERKPEGELRFSAIVHDNPKFGFYFTSASSDTPEEAVGKLVQEQAGHRDVEACRQKKIAELKEQIEKLQAVVLGLPPYRANRELAAQAESLKAQTVDVESEAVST